MNTKLLKLDPMVQMNIRQQCKDAAPNTLLAYILWAVLGWCGGHLFYIAAVARKSSDRTFFMIAGVVYLFTFGLFGLGWMFDIIGTGFYVSSVKTNNDQVIVDEYLVANGLVEKAEAVHVVKPKYDSSAWK
ncbi:hypothetical protein S140_148 [Shewanella sp. phage 1/40]|uniref:hypothetical protein n=1 Tax=Shewanella sp. phage 1/40 TaxID=1458860 RepID=UPI0004F727D6|nr:hypothetical protein S140_148 [Shewanella sp. phage 1/40]AHK11555.1 hypothetical protein S140_148 [Shewanella sp. phage 1/40]